MQKNYLKFSPNSWNICKPTKLPQTRAIVQFKGGLRPTPILPMKGFTVMYGAFAHQHSDFLIEFVCIFDFQRLILLNLNNFNKYFPKQLFNTKIEFIQKNVDLQILLKVCIAFSVIVNYIQLFNNILYSHLILEFVFRSKRNNVSFKGKL